jgi:uncharacterized protein YukE
VANSFFEIDTGILNQNIDEMRQQLENLKAKFDELISNINELDAMWDGPANDAFKLQFLEDCETYKDYCDVMTDYIECLEFASREYDSCESKVRSAIDAVRIEG